MHQPSGWGARVATASAATPSPRPTKPIPSPVVALTLTCAAPRPSAVGQRRADRVAVRPELRRAPARRSRRRGRPRARAPPTRPTTARSSPSESASAPALVGVGEVLADVAEAGGAEQRVDDRVGEDVGVGVARRGRGRAAMSTPPRISRRPATRRCESQPMPVRAAHRRSAPAAARGARTRRARSTPSVVEQLERLVVAEAELVGRVGVAGQRDRVAGVDDHLQERAGRVDLADRLAQPGGRDLDGDPGLGDPLHRDLVVEARVARRAAGARGPRCLTRSGWARMSYRPLRAASPSHSK